VHGNDDRRSWGSANQFTQFRGAPPTASDAEGIKAIEKAGHHFPHLCSPHGSGRPANRPEDIDDLANARAGVAAGPDW